MGAWLRGGGGGSAAISWGSRGTTWSHHILRLWGSRGERGDSAGPYVLPWGCGGPADPNLLPPQYFGILLLLFAAQITVAVIVYTQRVTVSAALPGVLAVPGGGGGPWGNTGAIGQGYGGTLAPWGRAVG